MELLINILVICIPTLFLAWLVPSKYQIIIIIVSTAVFIGVISAISLLILSVTTIFSYFLLKRYPTSTGATLTIVVLLASIWGFF
jgi:hypothetical protein